LTRSVRHQADVEQIHLKGPVVSAARQLFLPPIVVDRASESPLHRQISAQIATAIRGRAADGARLPSSRLLARLLGVSRNTVLTAYDELAADGLIDGRRGAAMMVTTRGSASGPDLRRLLRDAQYPSRTLDITDPDGSPLYLNF
jgi:DNA-binding transcriptional regulator YhcF (GntR family)